ncbi:hypothetical protein I350_02159 [Cryptococcus amylolentus CBS 6273]|uniref:alpha-galactosidase n=1 Tax=Cryptococcus amylolentus CBS 6273 TaxID=1296118 RepID=A0A1E3KAD6_9TREE|nr:hypothetical protein I350_02159 [Cryptococcus amylolentus CBS 6273]
MLPTAVLFSILFFFRPALGAPACRSSQTDDESASSITSHQSEVGTTIISATSIIATSTEIASSTSTASATSPSATGNATSSVALDSTFLYELDATSVHSPIISTNTGLSVDGQVYIVDAEGTSAETIAQYKANGKTVICYFSAGTWEPNRPDASSFDASCVCAAGESFTDDGFTSDENKLDDWDEWWLDIHSDSCKTSVQSVMTTRIEKAAAKGCDGFSNADQQHGNTAQDQVDYLLWLSSTAKANNNMLIDLKNAGSLLSEIVSAFDFSVIESCHEWDECDIYDSFLAAGKPEFMIEYGNTTSCPSMSDGQHLLVYSENDLNSGLITLVC